MIRRLLGDGPRRLTLLTTLSAVGLLLAAGAPLLQRLALVGTFWMLVVTFVVLATTARPLVDAARDGSWRPQLVPFGWALALSLALFAFVPCRFNVLADETNLVSTSLSLYLNRSLNNITEMIALGGRLQIVAQGLATRPGLFPFLVSLLHFPFGFRAGHAFAVNFIVCVGTLYVLVLVGRTLRDLRYGLWAAALLVAFPLFDIVAASAGYDAINHFFYLAVTLAVLRFQRAPSSSGCERLLILTALAAQCRYESLLLLLPVLVVILRAGRALVDARFSYRLPLVPLLLLPPLAHRLGQGVQGTESGQPELRSGPTFLVQAVPRNLAHAGEWLFDPHNAHYPVSRLVAGLALVGLLLIARRPAARRRRGPLLWFGATLLLFAAVHLSFAMGDLRTAYNMRLGTIYLGPLALVAAYPLVLAGERLVRTAPAHAAMLVAATAALLAMALPCARRNSVIGALTLAEEYRRNLQILAAFDPTRTLVVADRSGMYVAQGLNAIGPASLDRLLRQPIGALWPRAGEILLIQESEADAGPWRPAAPRGARLDPVASYRVGDRLRVSISRIGVQ